jgi:hypothetical protein
MFHPAKTAMDGWLPADFMKGATARVAFEPIGRLEQSTYRDDPEHQPRRWPLGLGVYA